MPKSEILVRQYYTKPPSLIKGYIFSPLKCITKKMEFHIDTDKKEPTPLLSQRLRAGVSPVCKKVGILYNIEKGVCQIVLLTRGGWEFVRFRR